MSRSSYKPSPNESGDHTVEKWDYLELSWHAQALGNPFLNVSLEATFTHSHRSVTVAGFHDGGDVYKIRFMPDMEGSWHYVTHSNLSSLDGLKGAFECTPAMGCNRGPVRVISRHHFAFADGTPYHPVGTTCYAWNHQGAELEEQTISSLKDAPFNKMRMCVFPKRYVFNHNEPPSYPFEGQVKRPWNPDNLKIPFDLDRVPPPKDYWDFTRFNPPHFRHLEKLILELRELNIQADLILFHPYDYNAWGFDQMPPEVNERYLKYLIARLSSFRNIWWSLANEYDLMLDRTMADWDNYGQLVQDCDPYDHLRSIHNCFAFYDHGKPWITHCSIQHHNLMEVPNWLPLYGKPVVVDECGYEGDIHMMWGDLSPEEMVHRFWLGFAAGGYVGHGETYGNDQDTLWWSKGGKLVGQSKARIAFLRQIIEAVPPPGLFPAPRFSPYEANMTSDWIVPEGSWNTVASSFNGTGFYLFYFGTHQPLTRNFVLPQGNFRADILDTWNMTITRFAENATGKLRVELPRQKYLAIRIEQNS